jgi:hypothetical protein
MSIQDGGNSKKRLWKYGIGHAVKVSESTKLIEYQDQV